MLSIGVLSLGMMSLGLLSLGLFAIGGLSAGCISIGVFATGAISLGIISIGAIAKGNFSVGALAIGKYFALGDNAQAMIATDNGIPDVDNLKVISKLLNVSIDYLLDDGEVMGEF